MQTCFICSSYAFLSHILCLQWAFLQPDPECCESLFIKSIPPLWPCGSHANCCLLRPFSTFSFTCTPTCACTHTYTRIHKAINIAGLWIRFGVAAKGLWGCRATWIWFRFSWWKLLVCNKFLDQCPCNGHYWAFQLDPGQGAGGMRWRSRRLAFYHLLLFHLVVAFSLSVYATQKQLDRKKNLFFGWVWIISLPSLFPPHPPHPKKPQIRTCSCNNKHVLSKKRNFVCVFWHKTIWSSLKVFVLCLSLSQKFCNLTHTVYVSV